MSGLGGTSDSSGFDYQAIEIIQNDIGTYGFKVLKRDHILVDEARVQIPGRHNIINGLAVLAVVDLLGEPVIEAAHALEMFSGTGRRFEIVGKKAGVLVIDDYAHHPTEISATLKAARDKYPHRRIWAVWQPHPFTRTMVFFDEFIDALQIVDCILVLEIYPAREQPPAGGFSSKLAVEKILQTGATSNSSVVYSPDLEDAREYLITNLKSGDVVVVMSAGDANELSKDLIENLKEN